MRGRRESPSKLSAIFAISIVFFSGAGRSSDTFVNAQLPWHPVVLDSQSRILAWYRPEENLGYDQFLRLNWDFLEHKVPIDKKTGVRAYLTFSMFDGETLQGTGWQHNPPSTFSHQMDALLGWYPYSGDREAISVLRSMLDYQLDHGTTPTDWDWAGVPFPTSCFSDKEYGHCIRDMPTGFYGGVEPDKVAELGLGYIQFYELTGEKRYLDAGTRCAEQLAKHVRAGDAAHTPWPFRVDARSGSVLAGEEYGGIIVASVRLFDEIIRIQNRTPKDDIYRVAREIAWKWILENPMNSTSPAFGKWSGYYEDIPKDTNNINDMNSMMTAYYILTQDVPASVDPQWKAHVGDLIDRSRELLGRGPFFGAWAIDEQLRPDGGIAGADFGLEQPQLDVIATLQHRASRRPSPDDALRNVDREAMPGGATLRTSGRACCSRAGLVCRTAQWGAINALYFERTGDGQAREDAFRSLNYATYFAQSDGKISAAGSDFDQYWFEDGYADSGRSFIWAMGAIPDFAPIGQSHLLRSNSVVRSIDYAEDHIRYETFDEVSTEVLRLKFRPSSISARNRRLSLSQTPSSDAYTVRTLAGGDYEIRVNHTHAHQIEIIR
jgi:hypothetical protein